MIATSPGRPGHPVDCVVIDPGMDAEPVVQQVLEHFHLRVAATVATHGHIDHVGDAQRIADAAGVPVFIHPADERLLSHPDEGLSPELMLLVNQMGVRTLVAPRRVEHLVDGGAVELAGITFQTSEAPGHTPGCTLLRVDGVPVADEQGNPAGEVPVVFTGDVLFQGAIGRTDLPGSDADAMTRSLRTRVLPLPDEAYLLPGHGEPTTMAVERATNPYLLRLG